MEPRPRSRYQNDALDRSAMDLREYGGLTSVFRGFAEIFPKVKIWLILVLRFDKNDEKT